MAETIVNFVLGKLGDAVVKEVLHLYSVNEQVEKVRRELIRIKAFLKDADRKQIKDERQKTWVMEIREIAHSIEDVIVEIVQIILIIISLSYFTEKVYGSSPYSPRALNWKYKIVSFFLYFFILFCCL